MDPSTRSPSLPTRRPPAAPSALAVLAAFALAATGCSDKVDPVGSGSLSDRLSSSWDRWQAWTAADYEFEFEWSCYCLEELTEPVLVRVVDHGVAEVTYRLDGAPVDPDYLLLFPAIPQLFLHIEEAIEADADVILVEFHEEHGYPLSAVLDYDAGTQDDELSFTVGEVSAGP